MMGNFLESNTGVALTVDGHMYCWGDNTWGQLGSNFPYADGTKYSTTPGGTGGLIKANYNGFHVATVDSITNKKQKLWIKKDKAGNPIKFTDVSVGEYHILAIEKDTGWVFGWGNNTFRQIGSSDKIRTDIPYDQYRPDPTTIDTDSKNGAYWITQFASGKRAKYISAGSTHSLAIVDI
jgi:alpha-tubulin suppressor-like RCC1 family protein